MVDEKKRPHALDGTELRFRMGTMTKRADPKRLRQLREEEKK